MARQKTRTAQDEAEQNRQKQIIFRGRRKADGYTEFKRWIKPLDKPPEKLQESAQGLLQLFIDCYPYQYERHEGPFWEDISALHGMLKYIGLVNNPI